MRKIKVGVLGFGLSGRTFHTPLLLAHGSYEIVMVNSSRQNGAHVQTVFQKLLNENRLGEIKQFESHFAHDDNRDLL
jgi:N-acetyl-gamma-glutamylphosphate reductase